MKIDCVIVTYNRLNFLKMAVEAVMNQTRLPDTIIIVDNLSTDGTREYLNSLDSDRLQLRFLDENLGGAGGFYHGIKTAYENDADWIWIMDDDSLPEKDALEKLISSSVFQRHENAGDIGFLASRVNWTDGSKCIMNSPLPNHVYWDWDLDDGCFRIDRCSFVSMLISRKAVQKIGYPVKEFFIWLDDWEYSGRITEQFPAFYVTDSRVVHQLPENRGVDYADINDQNLWKFLYEIRNQVSYLTYQKGLLGLADAMLFLLRRLVLMKRLKKSFYQQFKIFSSGIRGFFFNYRKFIEIPEK